MVRSGLRQTDWLWRMSRVSACIENGTASRFTGSSARADGLSRRHGNDEQARLRWRERIEQDVYGSGKPGPRALPAPVRRARRGLRFAERARIGALSASCRLRPRGLMGSALQASCRFRPRGVTEQALRASRGFGCAVRAGRASRVPGELRFTGCAAGLRTARVEQTSVGSVAIGQASVGSVAG